MPFDRSHLAKRLRLAALLGGAGAAILVGWGLTSRARAVVDMRDWSAARAVPTVRTVTPTAETGGDALELPGQLAAYNDAPIYARVAGYLRSWDQDIGAHVRAGQVLATIDAPELDQQWAEAKARLATAEATLKLAKVTAARFQDLAGDDAVSKQDADEKTGDLAAKTATVQALEANVQRLAVLEGFKRITAPFDGVVTERNANIGALVNAGAGSATASPLFKVSQVGKLRVYVNVPQSASAQVRRGMKANLSLPQYPGRSFSAVVDSDAGAVNDRSGALLLQLSVANDDNALKPGDFAQVTFDLPAAKGVVRIPASALIFRSQGLEVATVGQDLRVHLHKAAILQDLGQTVELDTGGAPLARVIDTPPDSLAEGDLVRIAPAEGNAHAKG